MGRVDCWYFCRGCKTRNKARPGLLFCPDCGGELAQIGYRTTVGNARRTPAASRHKPYNDHA